MRWASLSCGGSTKVTSATLGGWEADTPPGYARPVQDEDATLGLCGAELADGSGILMWPVDSGEVHFALVSSPDDFVVDDVVPSGDIQVAYDTGTPSGGTVASPPQSSVFVVDGELYSISVSRSGGVGNVDLWIADDPINPTSFSLLTNIQTADASSGDHFGSYMGAPIPLILDSGRWVLVGPRFSTEGLTFWWAQNVGAWYSDDDGATWTDVLNYQHVYFFTRTDTMSKQCARDPITGDLFFTSMATTSFVAVQTALWRSTDDGESWTLVDGDGGNYDTDPRLTTFVDNESRVFAATMFLSGGPNWRIYEYDGSGTTFDDFDDTGEQWLAAGATPDENTFKAVVAGYGVYFFTLDQVMRVLAQPLWHWGGLLFGRTGAWT